MDTYRPDRNQIIPHQNFVNLYFRKAWLEKTLSPLLNQGEIYQFHLTALKKRFGDNFSWKDQWYWDLLFMVNERGENLETAMRKLMTEAIDPDREDWIKNQIHNPTANFEGRYFLYGETKP